MNTDQQEKVTKKHSDTEILDWLESQDGIGISHERFGEYTYYANDANFPKVRELVNEILSGTHYTQR
jgi:hypothetical protein